MGSTIPPLIGQDALFQTIRQSLDNLPHIFVTGPPGCGKTTFLQHLLHMLSTEAPFQIDQVLLLSSEKDRGIHTIREKVNDFCKRSARTPTSLRFIIIDDADSLPLISQQALRRPMETYNHLTRFLFASRYPSHLIEALRSRCLHLELEPMSPTDILPQFAKENNLPLTPEFQDFCIRNYTSLGNFRSLCKLMKGLQTKYGSEDPMKHLKTILPTAKVHTERLIHALATNNASQVRNTITQFYLAGYLLDDILLSMEHSISVFPSVNPDIRYRTLRFIMLGWISIQQGKEHWMDTMDIVGQVLTEETPRRLDASPLSESSRP
jgi:DNA polymerase III delta prime subunit